jgi:hypothetical protein
MKTRATLHNNSFVTFKKLGTYGKLANQLFQVAAVVSYAKRNNIDYFLPNWSNGWTDGLDMTEIFRGPFNVDFRVLDARTEDFREKSMEYSDIPKLNRVNLVGYFQSERYFEEDLIREMFSIEPRIENEIMERNARTFEGRCSIHIRRQDYLSYPDIHPFLGIDYYQRAITLMKENGYERFLIFSDDLNWCREHFIGEEYAFSDKNTHNYEDLILMSLCSSHIIANSTFSWWAAWLSRNPAKIIIAPKLWFGHNGPQEHEIIPKKWIQI